MHDVLLESNRSPFVERKSARSVESLVDLVWGAGGRGATGEAFIFLDRHGVVEAMVSYESLPELVAKSAAAIQAIADPGEVIVLAGLEGLAFLEAFFGCIAAGVIPAPLPRPRHPRDQSALNRLQRVVAATSATAILAEEGTRELLAGKILVPQRTPQEMREHRGESRVPRPADPEQVAYLQFTSGSTADPRGVALSHRNVLAGLEYMHRAFAHEETLRVAGWLPLHHDMGLAGHVLLPLYEGGSAILMAPSTFLREPAIWLKAFQRFGANACAVPPFALECCLRKHLSDDPALDLSNWKRAYVGSETVPPAVLDRFAEAFAARGFKRDALRPCYGLAEATLFVGGAKPCSHGEPIGYALDREFVDVRIVDPVTGAAQPDGEPGEIWITGEAVSGNYQTSNGVEISSLQLPGSAERWTHTGDWGRILDGQLYLAGRTKDLVIIRGTKLAAADLEQTVKACHPSLLQSEATACFSLEQERGEAFMVVQEVPRHLVADLQEEIRERIIASLLDAHDASPAAVLLVPAGTLPRTANGKISRSECRQQFRSPEFLAESSRAVRRPASEAPVNGAKHDEDPVVIIGIACRFPGAPDVEAFWKLLAEGGDAITEVPSERWDYRLFHDDRPAVPGKMNSRWGGFVSGIDQFDPAFFGISAKEAAEVDPQHRLLLETSWRLFEQAGLKLDTVEKSETGVFVGVSTNDYLYTKIKLSPGMETFDAYSGLGNANSIAANRISYLFDLRGPSLAVDTACSSSLTAFHLAVESVRRGDCAMAIAGGANAILSPGPSITLSQFGMLAPDGRCKAFDARADGYVRAEGCGLVLLKRRSAALREGNHILATVRATAVGQDGRTLGITSPNGAAQKELLEKAARLARIQPSQVSYVEAHGTGTSAGDPVEVAQIKSIYGGSAADAPCYLGSVKANIGHLEAAAGIASVIKTVLMLQHQAVPPQIHVQSLNPLIDLSGSRLRIPSQLLPWEAEGKSRVAVVSSFGFGGANAHAVLEEALVAPTLAQPVDGTPLVFRLSCKSREALRPLARDWIAWLEAHPHVSLVEICAAQEATRTLFAVQEVWTISSRDELLARFEAFSGLSERGRISPHQNPEVTTEKPSAVLRVNLPGHPFVRRRHWIANGTAEQLARFAVTTESRVTSPPEEGAKAQPVEHAAPQATSGKSWSYGVEWVSRPFARDRRAPAARPASEVTNWIIVGDGSGLARTLVDQLKAESQPIFWIGSQPAGIPGVCGYPAPASGTMEAYGEILQHIITIAATEEAKSWRILYLSGLEAHRMHETTTVTLDRDQDVHGPGDVLRLTRAVIDTGRILPMWIVTSFAQSVQAAEWHDAAGAIQVTQAPLWGLGRTLFLEHPELRGGLIDVDLTHPKTAARQILWQATNPEGEHAAAFRGEERYVARIAPLPTVEPANPAFRADGPFVITGGMGGLGLRCAQWLVEHGARDLVLLGRRALPARAGWADLSSDHPLRAAADAIAALERRGAKVETVSLDTRDTAGLETLFAGLRQAGRPIRGVIHAAGVNWFGKIRQLDVGEFLETMKIKISAAWTLHELTRGDDLDCFLLFSSVSALWGSVDLSHYTAANHFLDALSCHRVALGLPALSVNWGPWDEAGMSAKPREIEVLHKLGLRPMPPEQAIAAMRSFELEKCPVGVIADIDWQKFQAFIDFSLSPSLFEKVAACSPRLDRGSAASAKSLAEANDPLGALEETIRKALGSVMLLEMTGPIELDQRFNLVGMDSLMSIAFAAELERALNLKLPNTLAYNYPTLRAVRDHLYALLQAEQRVPAAGDKASATPVSVPASITANGAEVRWFLLPDAASAARPRIYCFPCAGAGASSYASWPAAVSAWGDVVPAQYPGREELAEIPPLRSLRELAAALADRLPDAPAPFAFFGYSLGALVAISLAWELRRRGRATPSHLFLAGCGVPVAADNKSLHQLADEPFLEALSDHLGQLQGETRDFARAMLPLLRADIEMLESFHQLAAEAPLDCAITVLTGTEDSLTPRESVMRWSEMTTGDFTLRRFAGRHDFPKHQQSELLATIRALLSPSAIP